MRLGTIHGGFGVGWVHDFGVLSSVLLCQTSWHLFVRREGPLANAARDKHPPLLSPLRREGPLAK
jgi:hypothetical protein